MSWAAKRKIIYFLLALVFVFIIVVIPLYLYFIHQPATCFDGKQNQGETGVDCGGPCINLCANTEKNPIVVWSQSFQVVPNVYTAVAYVENQNFNAEAFDVPYTFNLYNENGNIVGTRQGTIQIPGGKNIPIIEPGIKIDNQTKVVKTTFQFDAPIQWKVGRKLPDLLVQDIALSDQNTSPLIDANIVNQSTMALGTINVYVLVYDTNNNAFAASKTFLQGMGPQISEHITFTWPEPFKNSVSHIEIIPVIQ